ncbi:hypothetical protein J3E69DRAFT_219103 [Trichoderma sp. SZMC 28015]
MRITRGMGMVLVMSFFSLQVQGSFFSQFLFSHSPRSLDALSVASTALKTGPRPKRRAQKTSIEFVSSGLPFAQPAFLPARLSKRHPAYECPEVSVQKQQPIILIVGPRLDSVQVQLGVSSTYSSSAQTQAQVMSRVCITDLIATDRQPVANRLDDRDSPAEG